MKAFQAPGFWHLPSDPSRQIAGTLHYSPQDGLRLSLTGVFTETSFTTAGGHYPTIFGVVSKSPYGRMFTLVDSFQTKSTWQMAGFATEEICVNKAYAGSLHLAEEDRRFTQFSVRFTELSNWLSITGISQDIVQIEGRFDGVDVKYRRPDTIDFDLRDNPFSIDFGFSVHQETPHQSAIHENVSIFVKDLDNLTDVEIFHRYIGPLQNFFTFATDTPNAAEDTTAYNKHFSLPGSQVLAPIHILGQPIYIPKEKPERRLAHQMLFTCDDVKGSLSDIVNRWLVFSADFKPFCDIFFGMQYAPSDYLDTKFLLMMQAMHLYFTKARSGDERFHKAVDAIANKLLKSCPDMNEHWLLESLPTEAELSFPWDLLEAIKEHWDVLGPLTGNDAERFVDGILATRNYLAHREPTQHDRALHGKQLLWTIKKLAMVLKVCVLDWIGISHDDAVKLFQRNATYAYLKTTDSCSD